MTASYGAQFAAGYAAGKAASNPLGCARECGLGASDDHGTNKRTRDAPIRRSRSSVWTGLESSSPWASSIDSRSVVRGACVGACDPPQAASRSMASSASTTPPTPRK